MDKHLRCARLHLLCGGEGVNELELCAAAQAALPEALGYPLCQDQRRKGPVSCRAACLTFEDQSLSTPADGQIPGVCCNEDESLKAEAITHLVPAISRALCGPVHSLSGAASVSVAQLQRSWRCCALQDGKTEHTIVGFSEFKTGDEALSCV